MNTITVYKVCGTWRGYIHSAIVGGYACHEYVVGQKTHYKPHCGPLTAFGTVEAAIEWIESMNISKPIIFKSKASRSSGRTVYRSTRHGQVSTSLLDLPDETILCNWIEPIEEIPQTVF